MRKLILILFLFLFSKIVFADVKTENYAWEDEDGNVHVSYYIPGSNDSLEQFLKDSGYTGGKIVELKDPSLMREKVEHLKFLGKSLVVDEEKKANDILAESEKLIERQSIFSKLKITEEEFNKIK